jgi:hypothetical protein
MDGSEFMGAIMIQYAEMRGDAGEVVARGEGDEVEVWSGHCYTFREGFIPGDPMIEKNSAQAMTYLHHKLRKIPQVIPQVI